MYRYDEFDHAFVRERVAQFRDQVGRRLSGDLDEEQFRPLRLQNGVGTANLSADETVTSWISTCTRISSFIQGIVQTSQCSEVPSEKAFVQPVHRPIANMGAP